MTYEYDPNSVEVDVEVEMGDWEQAASPQLIGTYGLGPCVGLALYSPAEQAGFLAHTMGRELLTVTDMLEKVSARGFESASLRAWLSGGGRTMELDGGKYYEEIRQDAVGLLTNIGIVKRNIEEIWVGDDQSADIILDCSTGVCSIDFFSMPSDHDF